MAKAQGKNAKTSSRRSAPPRNDDAERLAAIRWLAMKIEQVSIEVFVTNRDRLDEVVNALRATVGTLRQLGPSATLGECEFDCPPPYVLCKDCLCAPMCDDPRSSSRQSRKRKR